MKTFKLVVLELLVAGPPLLGTLVLDPQAIFAACSLEKDGMEWCGCELLHDVPPPPHWDVVEVYACCTGSAASGDICQAWTQWEFYALQCTGGEFRSDSMGEKGGCGRCDICFGGPEGIPVEGGKVKDACNNPPYPDCNPGLIGYVGHFFQGGQDAWKLHFKQWGLWIRSCCDNSCQHTGRQCSFAEYRSINGKSSYCCREH